MPGLVPGLIVGLTLALSVPVGAARANTAEAAVAQPASPVVRPRVLRFNAFARAPAHPAESLATPAVLTIGVSTEDGAIMVTGAGPSSAITISRAADAPGLPIDISRPRGLAASMRKNPGGTAGADIVFRRPVGMPLARAALTSGFGMRTHPLLGGRRVHSGIDLAAPWGTPIFASSDGMVRQANWAGGYGLMVAIDHGAGVQTRYGHMARIGVLPGQLVRRGDLIGYVGSTGRSTGPHLHYEMRVNGQAINPIR